MKIKIIEPVPVGKQHGIFVGKKFEVIGRKHNGYIVMGDAGETVLIYFRECETTEDTRKRKLTEEFLFKTLSHYR